MSTKDDFLRVQITVSSPIKKVWDVWNDPKHITQWCSGDDSWHTPAATNDLKVWWKFVTTMAAKDWSQSFDFNGIYTEIIPHKSIKYTIEGGRKVEVDFIQKGNDVEIIERFETDWIYSPELQIAWWTHILNNFKNYVEKQK